MKQTMKTLAVAAVCALGVSPVLAGDWTYSGGVLTDGNWSIAATLSSGKITVGAPTAGSGLLPANSWLKTFPRDTGLKLLFR